MPQTNKSKILFFINITLFPVTVFFFNFPESIAIHIFINAFLLFLLEINKSIDIRYLIILISSMQWLLGPVLSYEFVASKDPYAMRINSDEYFLFAVPVSLAFITGIFFPIKYRQINKSKIRNDLHNLNKENKYLPIILIITGLFFSIISNTEIASLRFIFFLLGGLQYVGLLLLTLNLSSKKSKYTLAVAVILLTTESILSGGLGLLFLWLILMFIIYTYFVNINLLQKIIILVSVSALVIIMQAVKFQYRDIVWHSAAELSTSDKIELMSNLIDQNLQNGISSPESENSTISRINQGWIISAIIKHVPYREPFAEGETIRRAVLSTFLPGNLYDDKLKAGGRKYFTRFTGKELVGSTSMNLSIPGEAYANYGKTGAIIFMFVWGIFLNTTFYFVVKQISKNSIFILFLPIIFQQAVKAENDIFIVLNHIVKSTVFILIVYETLKRVFKFKI